MQTLPGFREHYPEDYPFRRYIIETWRRVARTYGFSEYDAPTLEPCSLYEKKNSGGEILEQLYRFTDRGGREVALRPEMTPTLARMLAARASAARKPLKWFSVANFFRYERQQKGRLREFTQFNADIAGDASPAADAEMLALTIDLLRAFGFGEGDVVLRVSDRKAWLHFLSSQGVSLDHVPLLLAVVDKMERESREVTEGKLRDLGIDPTALDEFIASGGGESFAPLLADLQARGLAAFVEVDLTIVRGLAYYTGLVFEAFDRPRDFRALAGGGRYDSLVAHLSDGAADMPAIGVGMGDVVLGKLIEAHPEATRRFAVWNAGEPAAEVFVVVADETRRSEALELVSRLRAAAIRTDFALSAMKVGKQFAAAEASGARHALVVGNEWPEVKSKDLGARREEILSQDALAERIKNKQF